MFNFKQAFAINGYNIKLPSLILMSFTCSVLTTTSRTSKYRNNVGIILIQFNSFFDNSNDTVNSGSIIINVGECLVNNGSTFSIG